MEGLVLIEPTADYADEIRAYRGEFAGMLSWMHGSGGLAHFEDPAAWLDYLDVCADPDTVPVDGELGTQLIYVRLADRKIVGMLNIRHRHTEPLSVFGGHVGYSVRPTERRKGYAASMLREALPRCRDIGLDRVLLTCGEENVGSRKTILKNGGVFEGVVMSPKHHVNVERYWIELQAEK